MAVADNSGTKHNRTKQNAQKGAPRPKSERRPRQKTAAAPQPASTPTSEVSAEDARNELLRAHVGLVYHVAQQLGRVSAADNTFDDRVSAGMMGLMRAAEKYDPASGTTFSTYAAPCIRGAILDDLRSRDHVTRSVRTKARRMKQAQQALSQTLGRRPTELEMAEALDMDLETLWQWQTDVSHTTMFSLSDPVSEYGDNSNIVLGDIIAEEQVSVEGMIQREQEVALLRDAILLLPEQQRTVLSLSYFEELTLSQIAQVLNVSESRVSQVRTKALHALRTTLASAIN